MSSRSAVVRLRVAGQVLQVDAGNLELKRQDPVLVALEDGLHLARVLMVPAKTDAVDLPPIVRHVTPDDEAAAQRHTAHEKAAFERCGQCIRAKQLPMKLVAAELNPKADRVIFYFTSEQRVDFRALVKELARYLRMRIEMRQIGVRDAARYAGGIGICGRELCCASWLPEFKPVSIRMAKDQSLALNQDGLSGLCGRLRCCLRYEQELYQEVRRGLPKIGKRVGTPRGDGRVRDVNVLKGEVRVQLADGTLVEVARDDLGPATPIPDTPPKSSRDRRKKKDPSGGHSGGPR